MLAHTAQMSSCRGRLYRKDAIYVNTEGRVQLGERAAFPPGEAREDWAIIRALSGEMGIALSYDTQAALREKIQVTHPAFLALDMVEAAEWSEFGEEGRSMMHHSKALSVISI